MSFGQDYHNESMRLSTGMLPTLAPTPGQTFAQADYNQAQQSAASGSGQWVVPHHASGPRGRGRAEPSGAGVLVFVLLGGVVYGLDLVARTLEANVDLLVRLVVPAAVLFGLPLIGTLWHGPYRPVGALIAGYFRRVGRLLAALLLVALVAAAGLGFVFCAAYLVEAGFVTQQGLSPRLVSPGWPPLWAAAAGTCAVVVIAGAAGTWRVATGLRGGAAIGVLVLGGIVAVPLLEGFPRVLADAEAVERFVEQLAGLS